MGKESVEQSGFLTGLKGEIKYQYRELMFNHSIGSFVRSYSKGLKKGGIIDAVAAKIYHPIVAETIASGSLKEKEDHFDEQVQLLIDGSIEPHSTGEEKAMVTRLVCGAVALHLYKQAQRNSDNPNIALSHVASARRTLLHSVNATEELQPGVRIDRSWVNWEICRHNGTLQELTDKINKFISEPPAFVEEY